MNKKFFQRFLIITASVFAVFFTFNLEKSFGATLVSSDNSAFSNDNQGINTMLGETFTVSASSTDVITITGTKLKVTKGNTTPCTNLQIDLRATDYSGTLLATKQFLCSTIPAYGTYSTPTTFTFDSGVMVNANTTYFIGIKALDGTGGDVIRLDMQTPSNYSGGILSINATTYSTYDMDFWIEGNYSTATTSTSTSTSTTTTLAFTLTSEIYYALIIWLIIFAGVIWLTRKFI